MGVIDTPTVTEYSEESEAKKANVAKSQSIENGLDDNEDSEDFSDDEPSENELDDNEDLEDDEPSFPYEHRGKQVGQAAGKPVKAKSIRPDKDDKSKSQLKEELDKLDERAQANKAKAGKVKDKKV